MELTLGEQTVNAAALRIALGSEKMRSTLLTDIVCDETGVTFSGKGFGHGVGMSQWGACELADRGKSAQEIVEYYFQSVKIADLW